MCISAPGRGRNSPRPPHLAVPGGKGAGRVVRKGKEGAPPPPLLTLGLRGGARAGRGSGRGEGQAAQRQPRGLLGFLVHNLEDTAALPAPHSGLAGAEAVARLVVVALGRSTRCCRSRGRTETRAAGARSPVGLPVGVPPRACPSGQQRVGRSPVRTHKRPHGAKDRHRGRERGGICIPKPDGPVRPRGQGSPPAPWPQHEPRLQARRAEQALRGPRGRRAGTRPPTTMASLSCTSSRASSQALPQGLRLSLASPAVSPFPSPRLPAAPLRPASLCFPTCGQAPQGWALSPAAPTPAPTTPAERAHMPTSGPLHYLFPLPEPLLPLVP